MAVTKVLSGIFLVDELPVIHRDQSVGRMEIMIIVSGGNYGLTLFFQGWQNIVIEMFAEVGVLIGSPFVDDIDRTVLQPCNDHRQPLTLTGREV